MKDAPKRTEHSHGLRYPNRHVVTHHNSIGGRRFRVAIDPEKRLTDHEALLLAAHLVVSVNQDAAFFGLLHNVCRQVRQK